MKSKTNPFVVARVTLGISLVVYSVYNVVKYANFLNKLDSYFDVVTIFDLSMIEALAPLIPFEEFLIGVFLVMGLFKREVLIVSSILFAFFTAFLLDASHFYCALIYSVLTLLTIILLKNNKYDVNNTTSYPKGYYPIV